MDIFEKLPSLPKLPEIPDKLDLKTFQRLTATILYIYFLCKLLFAFVSSHIFNPMFPSGLGGGFGEFILITLKVMPAASMEALSGLIGYSIFKCESEMKDAGEHKSNRGYLIAIVVMDVACIIYKALVFGAGNYVFVHIPFTSLITIIGAIILNLSEEEPVCIVVEEIVVQPPTPPAPEVKEAPAPKKISGMVKVFEAGATDKNPHKAIKPPELYKLAPAATKPPRKMNQHAAAPSQMPSPRLFTRIIAHIMTGFFMLRLLMCCIALMLLTTPASIGLMRVVPNFVSKLYPSCGTNFFYDHNNFAKFAGFYGFLFFEILCNVAGINLFDNEIRKCNYRLFDHISTYPLSFIALILSNTISKALGLWVFDLITIPCAYIPITSILSLISIILICLGEAPTYHDNNGQIFVKGCVYPDQITVVTSSAIQANTTQPQITMTPSQGTSTTTATIYSAPTVKTDVESPPLYNAALSTLNHAGHDAKF